MKTKLLKKLRNKISLRFNRITKEYEVVENSGYIIVRHTCKEYQIACAYYRYIILMLARKRYGKTLNKYRYLK